MLGLSAHSEFVMDLPQILNLCGAPKRGASAYPRHLGAVRLGWVVSSRPTSG